jgi:RNA polymerase sigma factor (sigma-70 family)
MTSNNLIHIGILEDNTILRDSICDYLKTRENIVVSFAISRYAELTEGSINTPVDIILLDVHLRDGISIENISEIQAYFPSAKVLILTGDENENILVKSIENGAVGYLLKPFSMSTLIDTIEIVNEKGHYLSLELTQKLMKVLNKKKFNQFNIRLELLSSREKRVIDLLQQGYSYKEIASILGISYHTVNQHIKNSYKKLNVNNKYDLINFKFTENK